MDEEEVLTAIAWSLVKDPYMSAGGRHMRGRVFRLMVVDTYVITDFHALGRKPRLTITEYASRRMAHHRAIRETQERERQGFQLRHGPVSKETKAGVRTHLEGLRDFKGYDSNMASSIEHCLIHGKPLSEENVSPAVSPF